MALSVSVVIPVHNDPAHLRSCLEHLARSSVAPFECIVVDDGSTDNTLEIAREFDVQTLSTEGRRGPAYARNLGAKAAKGEIVFFIDADVCVYPNTVERLLDNFEEDPEMDALMGSYDDSPHSQDFLSQYKNLMHCFVHQQSRRSACTFWSGCGAIRREVFLQHSGFDESYGRPAIEDIELGYRLARAGRKLVLDKELTVKHLKRWSFWGLLKTDILDRAIPWTELILRDRSMPNDLNLQVSQRVSVASTFLLLGMATLIAIYWRGYFLTPLFAMLFFLLARYWVEAAVRPQSKWVLVGVGGIVATIVSLAYMHHMMGLIPLVLLGCVLIFGRHRYAYSSERKRRVTGVVLAVYMLIAVIFVLAYLPKHALILSFLLVLLLIVILNNQFYLFLAAKRGRFFALAAIPFHLLYHFYNGISFLVGLLRYTWGTLGVQKGVARHSVVSNIARDEG